MFSDVTSVIIAMMVEVAQRMLTNLPTVPRTSERGIWPDASRPTRASEPRTEITRPKELTVSNLACHKNGSSTHYGGCPWKKRLSPRDREFLKSAAFWRSCGKAAGEALRMLGNRGADSGP